MNGVTFMNGKSKILWIARTALFIALLVGLQAVTAPLSQFVTGSIVNLLLILAVMTCGYMSGIAVAVVSPIMAKLVGIGPLWGLIPFVALGNIVLVLLWRSIGERGKEHKIALYIVTLIVAAVAKFLVLYIGVTKIAAPVIFGLPAASPIYVMFSFPQLVTAAIGGVLAILILPTLQKAIQRQST